MFGFHNYRGSCWVNTCLQCVFRIPDVQERYTTKTFEEGNLIDECLCKIWNSKGEQGLKEFFDAVRTDSMPAGRGIGDSHELLQYLCDKLPYLDKLMRFKIADTIKCNSCEYKEIKEDSVTEFSIATQKQSVPLIECIAEVVKPYTIESWKCEKCGNLGCTKQQLIGSFPKVMMFHMIPLNGWVDYCSILGLNKRQYALCSVGCFNGGHWWAYGRNMPPGSSWYTLNDTRIEEHGPKQFPVSNKMRILIYYRLEN
jgi:ubiquitin C-terminal hydrolase